MRGRIAWQALRPRCNDYPPKCGAFKQRLYGLLLQIKNPAFQWAGSRFRWIKKGNRAMRAELLRAALSAKATGPAGAFDAGVSIDQRLVVAHLHEAALVLVDAVGLVQGIFCQGIDAPHVLDKFHQSLG